MVSNANFYKSYTLRGDADRDIQVAKYEVEYESTYHLKNLYWLMHEWFDIEGFKSLEGDDFFENLYWQRVKPDGMMEHHIWWRCVKVPQKNSYYRYFIKVDFQTLAMSATGKAEIMRGGKKFKVNEGDIIIRVESYLQLDYQNEWQTHWLLKNFDTWYRKRFFKKHVEDLKRDLYKITYRLQDTIKQYLDLHTRYDQPKQFHPNRTL
jgi:hypothetical protein